MQAVLQFHELPVDVLVGLDLAAVCGRLALVGFFLGGALLALLLPGAGCRETPCVAVSWPAFYDDLRALVREILLTLLVTE